VDADDVRSVFKTDSEVKRALAIYLKDHEEVDEQEDEDEDEDEDY
jgi:hypothetical protein